MEDTLREKNKVMNAMNNFCLNPCFNGRYSQRKRLKRLEKSIAVLILVLMEDTLRVNAASTQSDGVVVLILVLMEDTLRG